MNEQHNLKQFSNGFSFNEITNLQLLRQRIRCPKNNLALLVCKSQKCLIPGLICQNSKCDCIKQHKACSYKAVQKIIQAINLRKQKPSQERQKIYHNIKNQITRLIQELSLIKQKIEKQQELFGLSQAQKQFCILVNQYKIQSINGQLLYQVQKKLQTPIHLSKIIMSQIQAQMLSRMQNFNKITKSYQSFIFRDYCFNKQIQLYPHDIRKILAGIQKIQISPYTKTSQFNYSVIKEELNAKKNKVLKTRWHSFRFSKQSLPIKNKSFYFNIKLHKLSNPLKLSIGIAFPINLKYDNFLHYNLIGYDIKNNKLIKYYQQNPKNNDSNLKSDSTIKNTPSQIFVVVTNNSFQKTIEWIYNDRIQKRIELDQKILQNKIQCHAYIEIGQDSEIQFM